MVEPSQKVQKCYSVREVEKIHFQRVLKFAESAAKIPKLSSSSQDSTKDNDLLFWDTESWFHEQSFLQVFPRFDLFINECRALKLGLMISGSSVVYALKNRVLIRSYWRPVDIDIYMLQCVDQLETLSSLEQVIQKVYGGDHQISIVRTPYMMTWFVLTKDKERETIVVSYQVILSPVLHWSHVFAGYHTDLVCCGYIVLDRAFLVSSRFKYWFENLNSVFSLSDPHQNLMNYEQFRLTLMRGDVSFNDFCRHSGSICFFFPDFVTPRFRERVFSACEKYLNRGFLCHYVEPFEDLFLPDVERSGEIYSVDRILSLTRYRKRTDSSILVKSLPEPGILAVGQRLCDVYDGEQFSSILETMSCFQQCPGGCGSFVICTKLKHETGAFCDQCLLKENEKLTNVRKFLHDFSQNGYVAAVTGGRCGLGRQMLMEMTNAGVNCYATTRFLSQVDDELKQKKNVKMLELDLKEPTYGQWKEMIYLLENAKINLLVLSASETLHFPNDDALRDRKEECKDVQVDWTHDMIRPNSGIWHKTLDQLSWNEVHSPVMTNIVGTSLLLSAFLKGVKFARSSGNNDFFGCIVVTSFEGVFLPKNPFHPITNACKSALEQVVWTVQSQSRVLKCPVVLSDPGWVYTESLAGKTRGPVPIHFGVGQILSPLLQIGNSTSNRQTPTSLANILFTRQRVCVTEKMVYNMEESESIPIVLKLEPCGHFYKYKRSQHLKGMINVCPKCKIDLTGRNFVTKEVLLLSYMIINNLKLRKVPNDLIMFILRMSELPF